MFTGIIESTGVVDSFIENGTNRTFWLSSPLSDEFKIDQSVSHNGVCLTVEAIEPGRHQVTAIAETLNKTNLGTWKPGQIVNIERSMMLNARLDGHIVQGHVDTVAKCVSLIENDGSWNFRFAIPEQYASLIIEKGSICINGISLTIFDVTDTAFSVAIIPYTWHHTNLQQVKLNDTVNIEFDMVGKYINRINDIARQQTSSI